MAPPDTSDWDSLLSAAHVWHGSPENPAIAAAADRCVAWLAPNERTHLERIRSDPLRRIYLATRAICRATLSRYTGVHPSAWRFIENVNGKPAIAEPGGFDSLQFNLTHTGGLIACIVSRAGAVGIDAEETTRIVDVSRVAHHFLPTEEQTRLADLPPEHRVDRFFKLWVLKEAFLKSVGLGLAQLSDQFTVELTDGEDILLVGDGQLAIHRPTSHHMAATCIHLPNGHIPVPILWLPADDLFKTGIAVES